MKHPIFLQKRLKWLVVKVSLIVTQKSSKCAKSCENMFLKEFDNNIKIIGWGGTGFHPLRDIVNCNKDVEIVMGNRKRIDEVNPL